MTNQSCCVCSGGTVREVPAYRTLRRVTSDCRPWPSGGRLCVCESCSAAQCVADDAFLREIDDIYAGYAIYDQAEGAEQPVFDATGAGSARSSRILDQLIMQFPLPPNGRALDVGCGNGSTLRAFSNARPNWKLAGTELNDKYKAKVAAIANAEPLYTCAPSEVHGTFDVITLIHVLEHIVHPGDLLASLKPRLSTSGLLVIQVPSYGPNPFELLIADHRTHFTAATLRLLLEREGFDVAFIGETWVTKELSAVARVRPGGKATPKQIDLTGVRESLESKLTWLIRVVASARQCEPQAFGLFGTSIAASWLFSELGAAPAFFVDEDPSRVGKTWMDRPIFHPRDVPAASRVFIGLPSRIATTIAQRLKDLPVEWVLPPVDG